MTADHPPVSGEPRTKAGRVLAATDKSDALLRLILAIEAEASTGAAPLYAARLAEAMSNVTGDGRVWTVDLNEARKIAAEYARLAEQEGEGQ